MPPSPARSPILDDNPTDGSAKVAVASGVFCELLNEDELKEFYDRTEFNEDELKKLLVEFKTVRSDISKQRKVRCKKTMTNLIHENTLINMEEFVAILKKTFTRSLKLPTMERAFQLFDKDQSGFIDLAEFIIGMNQMLCHSIESSMEFTFNLFDLNNDGKISRNELAFILRTAYKLNSGTDDFEECLRDVLEYFNQLDENNDRCISFEEFQRGIKKFPKIFTDCFVIMRNELTQQNEEAVTKRLDALKKDVVYAAGTENEKENVLGEFLQDPSSRSRPVSAQIRGSHANINDSRKAKNVLKLSPPISRPKSNPTLFPEITSGNRRDSRGNAETEGEDGKESPVLPVIRRVRSPYAAVTDRDETS